MGQSLARLHIHVIFSTKHRELWITDAVRDSLHAYMAKVLQDIECRPVLINSVEDHIHLLFDLARTVAVSVVVERVKKSTSKWIKTQGQEFRGFAWQAGYGAFAVSESNLSSVRHYVASCPQGVALGCLKSPLWGFRTCSAACPPVQAQSVGVLPRAQEGSAPRQSFRGYVPSFCLFDEF
ncbi:MAG: IS200/IS605 family transposase [Pirellulales bacterium]|nr:IS200/IS605 family transposase [Pirellulales bacterium]